MKAKNVTKKALSFMLSLLMIMSVVSISFTAGAASCDHSAFENDPTIEWEIIEPATCAKDGRKRTVCQVCFEPVLYAIPRDENAHIAGPWETVIHHSCTQPGLEKRYCINRCYETDVNGRPTDKLVVLDSRDIPMHDFNRLYGDDATCSMAGYEYVMCTSCYAMETRTLDIIPEAHKMSKWVTVTEATCAGNSGVRKRYCLNCDENGNQCPKTEIEYFTDYNNHIDVQWNEDARIEATCLAPGYVPGICNECGLAVSYELPQHSQAEYTVLSSTPSTCVSEGVERRVCKGDRTADGYTGCGYEYEVVLPITDKSQHVVGDWKVEKEASCTPGLRYKSCIYHSQGGRIEEEIPANGQHNYGDWVVEVEPDCSSTGVRTKTCKDCSHTVSEELPTKHNFLDWTVVEEMNCDETQLQQGTKLAKCNDCSFEKYFTIPTNHDFTTWYVISRAECGTNTPGVMERVCKSCNKRETKSYTQEHDFCDWYVSAAPVCAANGFSGRAGEYTRYCEVCKTKETKVIPVTHEFIDWKVVEYPIHKDGSPIKTGTKVGKCKFCGEEKTEIMEVEHIFGDWEVIAESVCDPDDSSKIKKGTKARSCIICSYTETEELPLHKFGEWYGFDCNSTDNTVISRNCTICGVLETKNYEKHPNLRTSVVKPSCTTSGYTVKYCPDCGITENTDIVRPTGHALDENWVTVVSATCTTEGSKYKPCSNCDYLEFVYYDKADHMLIEIEPGVEPGCTTPGKTAKSYCAECKQIFESKVLEPTGHRFDNGSEICKVCKVYFGTECTCACHSTSGMEVLVFKIICKLYQMIGINQFCKCGDMHYEEVGFLAKLFGKG